MRIQRVWSFLAKASMVCAALLFVSTTQAQTGFNAASGDWNVAGNWTGGAVPGAGDPQIHVGSTLAGSALVADVTIVGAPLNDPVGEMRIGAGDNSNGILRMNTGTLTSNGWSFIGVDGVGGTNIGTLDLSGDASYVQANERLLLGSGGGTGVNTGIINISEFASLTTNSGFNVGDNDGNAGMINQTGGTVNANAWLSIGNTNNATGTYNISAGVLNSVNPGNFISVGDNFGNPNGTATGTMNISGTADINATGNGINIGANDGAVGNFNVTGSTASIDSINFLAATAGDLSGNPIAATANLAWTSDGVGVSAVVVSGLTSLNDGTAVGTSTLTVDLTSHADFGTYGSGPVAVDEFILIDNQTAATVGTFAGLAEGAIISIGGGKTGVLSYVGGADGLDVSVTVFNIPEPSAVALLGLAVAGIATRRRRT